MRVLAGRTIAVAMALPTLTLARAAVTGNRRDLAIRLRHRAARVRRLALVATVPCWFIVVFRGVLYPIFGADNLEGSWGGPTLIDAWAVHLAIGLAVLLVVSFLFAAVAGTGAGSDE